MSNVSGIGLCGSDATASVLSNKEMQYFKRVFAANAENAQQPAQPAPVQNAKPGVGTRLDVKV
ncbi:hypothetical protein DesfrDRAFT_3610 [Solidesulfovibrio fructosivorans JJ]]|uniref:Uncharacterized protein n=1 Tax=Solidesulfovibrio fructosivorans JJ] TaxID=596151 RepID=E1K160_SOLFR|nr:hypothetical protein [Solidesulfovibrio fructosivorans]EFL49687.1 hypothetical protein DesfrDRAFT_3610 [Solidesulfovibrio fructosivorans JJ]]